MKKGYPIYTKAAQKGERGVDIVSRIISNEYGWLFKRNHQEHDFGIDAQVDVVLDDGTVTGQMLALQIKYGTSFFREKNKWGYIYRGDKKHFNYISNYPIPVLIIICHPEEDECYWVLFEPAATLQSGDNWKITIPFENKLLSSKEELSNILQPPNDYLKEVEDYWAMNDVIVKHSHFLYIIDKQDVNELNVSDVKLFFQRLTSSREMAEHCQGKVEISFHGYDQDPRELFEIPEVRSYASLLSKALPDLFFFAYIGPNGNGLKTIAMCLTDVKRLSKKSIHDGKIPVEISLLGVALFMEEHWPGLNEMTDWLKMPIEENKRISFNIMRELGFEPPKGY
ncbi:DUF4365 and DUF1817 domain-containing protein [Cronobacter dublinensis]|uniref:DUF4365 and DUF1817 domain-containing protein n=1 Tax=Cronobacter dublinensis TaxID=413497 RepID=UPI0024C23592|nr:DUF4365 and DUF1817 domain-containing protein [Cronobacter dublinensis]MDK1199553.1 DUF4365 and DUF1817 domain-containing protein [Cronobacter dublinensis]